MTSSGVVLIIILLVISFALTFLTRTSTSFKDSIRKTTCKTRVILSCILVIVLLATSLFLSLTTAPKVAKKTEKEEKKTTITGGSGGPQARMNSPVPPSLTVGMPFTINPSTDTDPNPHRLKVSLPPLKQGDRIVFEREVNFSFPTDIWVNDLRWGKGMNRRVKKGEELIVAQGATDSFILFHSSGGPVELAPLRVRIMK